MACLDQDFASFERVIVRRSPRIRAGRRDEPCPGVNVDNFITGFASPIPIAIRAMRIRSSVEPEIALSAASDCLDPTCHFMRSAHYFTFGLLVYRHTRPLAMRVPTSDCPSITRNPNEPLSHETSYCPADGHMLSHSSTCPKTPAKLRTNRSPQRPTPKPSPCPFQPLTPYFLGPPWRTSALLGVDPYRIVG